MDDGSQIYRVSTDYAPEWPQTRGMIRDDEYKSSVFPYRNPQYTVEMVAVPYGAALTFTRSDG